MLQKVVVYYKENVSPTIAKKIRNEIFRATIQLEKHPKMGQENSKPNPCFPSTNQLSN
jgi:plasmid stabilization system protein ParE